SPRSFYLLAFSPSRLSYFLNASSNHRSSLLVRQDADRSSLFEPNSPLISSRFPACIRPVIGREKEEQGERQLGDRDQTTNSLCSPPAAYVAHHRSALVAAHAGVV
ncbi:hypothetical protein CORC01_11724, partial [Colletotrichum orchidophilum]